MRRSILQKVAAPDRPSRRGLPASLPELHRPSAEVGVTDERYDRDGGANLRARRDQHGDEDQREARDREEREADRGRVSPGGVENSHAGSVTRRA